MCNERPLERGVLGEALDEVGRQCRTIVRPVHLSARGFADDPTVFDPALQLVEESLRRTLADGVTDPHRLSQVIRRTIGKWVSDTYRRRPMIIPTVLEV